jgi:N-acyl homoserine lactone hydrolase
MRILALLLLLGLTPTMAHAPRTVLWRLDCGSFVTQGLSDGCYLVRHKGRYLLWDAGLDGDLAGKSPQQLHGHAVQLRASLIDQLALLGLKRDDISVLAISHPHFDHIGQAAAFPQAVLMIGKQDWDGLLAHPSDLSERLGPWVTGHAKVEPVAGDKDVFGDGAVVMLAVPGHTPGHHALMLRLDRLGTVLLTGDLFDSAAQRRDGTIMPHNADPAATRASYARFNRIAAQSHAIVIIPHDSDDIAKLPAFPHAAD